MNSHDTPSTVLGADIVEWLAVEALRNSDPAAICGALCQRLRAIGVPILRGYVSFRILHPLYDSSSMTWTAETGVVVDLFQGGGDTGQGPFWDGPLGYVLKQRLPTLRRRLVGETALLDFAVLEEFRALGGADYVVVTVAFDRSGANGIICSWLGDRASGFTDGEIALLQRTTRELAIALKSKLERSVTQNVAHAYLGKRAGEAVLNGSIRRGDGEKIMAALWYSDLRRSTELADHLSAEAFLQLLGRYFEMTAASVLDHDGEVVSLIGDAVLGVFRVDGAPEAACRRALAAAQAARRRLADAMPFKPGQELDFGVALHLGQVIYGNVGVPERLQFTLVGAAVNEVVRVQDLTKELACPVLATATFAAAAPGSWRPLGAHRLRGLETPMEILTPAAADRGA